MRNLGAKRYGAHVVERGKYKGALHAATRASQRFRGELLVVDNYLDTWVLPQEPEEATMMRIILNLQNIMEHEIELAIASTAERSEKEKDKRFQERIEQGFVSFKSKFQGLSKRRLITETEADVMEEIRRVRNEQIHSRPTEKRRKLKYFDSPLLTRKALERILLDVQPLVGKLCRISGTAKQRAIIPPHFFDEDQWNPKHRSKSSAPE
jgi:hypothetical protein